LLTPMGSFFIFRPPVERWLDSSCASAGYGATVKILQ